MMTASDVSAITKPWEVQRKVSSNILVCLLWYVFANRGRTKT